MISQPYRNNVQMDGRMVERQASIQQQGYEYHFTKIDWIQSTSKQLTNLTNQIALIKQSITNNIIPSQSKQPTHVQYTNMNSHRKMTPKGHMSSNGSGPPIMMMPDNIRATFMPDPPLRHLPPPKRKRPKAYTPEGLVPVKQESGIPKDIGNVSASGRKATGLTGVAAFMAQFERTSAPKRVLQSTSKTLKELKKKKREEKLKEVMGPLIEEYRKEQRESSGEFRNMNCYNTLFVGRLAYEVTERKLLREFESFGAVKDIKLVPVKGGEREGKSKGYAFVEFEQEDDMKRAYRSADGMRIEGREIVVDVERGHTVPNWLPRRLGGGLGGTRWVYCYVMLLYVQSLEWTSLHFLHVSYFNYFKFT